MAILQNISTWYFCDATGERDVAGKVTRPKGEKGDTVIMHLCDDVGRQMTLPVTIIDSPSNKITQTILGNAIANGTTYRIEAFINAGYPELDSVKLFEGVPTRSLA